MQGKMTDSAIRHHESFLYSKVFWLSLIPLLIIVLAEIFKIVFLDEIRLFFSGDELGMKAYLEKLTIFQLICMPLVGFLSDKIGRKKVLLSSLMALFLSVFLLKMHAHIFVTTFFYALGAVIPVARAAYCDVHTTNQRVPNVINTFLVQPIPWIVFFRISFMNWSSWPAFISAASVFFVALLFFKDRSDRRHTLTPYKFEGITKAGGLSVFLRVICAFIAANSIWTILQYYLEEKQSFIEINQYFSLSQGVAFFLGVLIARFVEIDTKKMFGLNSVITAVFISLQVLVWWITNYEWDIIPFIFVVFTFFGGIGQPLIYSLFGRKASIHEQGVLYGFIESCQLFTEWVGSASLNHVSVFQDPSAIVTVVLIGSFVSVLLTIGFIRTKWRRSS